MIHVTFRLGFWEEVSLVTWRFGRHAAFGVLISVLVAVAGCSAPDASEPRGGSPGRTAPSAVPTTSASPADVAGEKAIDAYVGMWNDMVEAGKTSNWEDPRLARHATKDALRVITGSLYADKKNGLVTKGRPTYDPKVTSVKPKDEPTTVMISDCGDSTNSLKYREKDGQRASSSGGGRRQITAEVKLQDDGEWRVTRFAVEELGSC